MGTSLLDEARDALGKIDPDWRSSGEAIGAMPSLLPKLRQENTRVYAGQALREFRDAALGVIIAAAHDKDPEVRQTVAGLLRLSDPRTIEPLLSLLADQDPSVREEAATSLYGRTLDEQGVHALITAIGDENGCVSGAALATLRS